MLDSNTKRKINSARNILVGKIPVPKSQIDLITITMIYKFMDDMDRQAEEFDGKASYFIGNFEKYSWAKIMDQSLGGYERLQLFDEGLLRMNQNPHLPDLFRDIFKNAFLPFRDPETLNMFLEEINGFDYEHSEKLGDAFEYLLSIMSSQGDAGQFRTPRHIIEFIVNNVNPDKNDIILDPACGTASFLISAYKHIIDENTEDYRGDLLNSDEREKLVHSIVGYDISPDMVRLSLVNMFLHKFPKPQIFEYDTLTSQDRWDDNFSCILANPPFMSPKGGIKPHERFAIKSKRSEVLFVDYMMEHLTEDGKAGIIVPEGIIFQSQKAHKELRKKMVEDNYLWAVVSLPAGVFQPYSGVKTSVLMFDRSIAKLTDNILFVKVDADGLDLGAQRKAIDDNDLPEATKALSYFKSHLSLLPESDQESNSIVLDDKGTKLDLGNDNTLAWRDYIAHTTSKSKLAENDYNLSGERYRIVKKKTGKWNMVKLEEICDFKYGKSLKKDNRIAGKYPVFGSNGIVGYHNDFIANAPFIVVGRKGSAGEIVYSEQDGFPIDTTFYIEKDKNSIFDTKYLYRILKGGILKNLNTQAGVPGLNRNDAYNIKIPLPTLEIQQEIVAEIEGYQKIIDGAKQIVDNYKPNIDIDPEWDVVPLEQVCEIKHGFAFKSEFFIKENIGDNPILLTPGNFSQKGGLYFSNKNLKGYSGDYPKEYKLNINDLIIVMTDLSPKMKILGNPAIVENDNYLHNQRIGKIILTNKKVIKKYLFFMFLSDFVRNRIKQESTGAIIKHTSPNRILNTLFPLPPLSIQQEIVSKKEEEQKYIEGCKKLIEINEQKIKNRIDKVWEG
ncbi:MAG: N-6 DNA methylase [Candidatus Cloacimonetes bacterium]|nr:N-6 DNA methylase [Candidatus Cloacimonadota bacterium]